MGPAKCSFICGVWELKVNDYNSADADMQIEADVPGHSKCERKKICPNRGNSFEVF